MWFRTYFTLLPLFLPILAQGFQRLPLGPYTVRLVVVCKSRRLVEKTSKVWPCQLKE